MCSHQSPTKWNVSLRWLRSSVHWNLKTSQNQTPSDNTALVGYKNSFLQYAPACAKKWLPMTTQLLLPYKNTTQTKEGEEQKGWNLWSQHYLKAIFQVPLKGRGKKNQTNEQKKRKKKPFCKVQNIRRIKVQVILKLSRFAMDVLHDTFHMTDFRRELRLFSFSPSPHRRGAGNNTGKRKTVIKTWNAETCTVSWWEEPVSVYSFEHVWLSNCGFCTWWEEQV